MVQVTYMLPPSAPLLAFRLTPTDRTHAVTLSAYPSRAPGADAATPPDSPVGGLASFFEFLGHRGGADVQHARGIPNAAGILCHVDNLLLDRRDFPA